MGAMGDVSLRCQFGELGRESWLSDRSSQSPDYSYFSYCHCFCLVENLSIGLARGWKQDTIDRRCARALDHQKESDWQYEEMKFKPCTALCAKARAQRLSIVSC